MFKKAVYILFTKLSTFLNGEFSLNILCELDDFTIRLGMGYVILLWHSLSLPYNYFDDFTNGTYFGKTKILKCHDEQSR